MALLESKSILGAIDAAKKSGRTVSDVVVAEETPPKITVPTRIEHRPREKEEALPSLKPVQGFLELEKPEEVEEAGKDVATLAVKGGGLLALKVVGAVEPGKSVRGDP